ncbi:MAG: hypothetical protein JXR11_04245 [Balneola sp.]
MELISHLNFGNLRLKNFISQNSQIESLTDWEFMGDYWIGEALGFNEWLRLEVKPEETRSISVNLDDFDLDELSKIFDALKVPLRPGMTFDEIKKILGAPLNTESFAGDRKSYEFIVGNKDEYYVSCTVVDKEGFTYFVMMNHENTISELKKSASNKT